MTKSLARKYLKDISSYKKKYVTVDLLSNKVGKYPEIIAEELSYFEPLLRMDPSYNVKDLIPSIEKYLEEQENKEKEKKERPVQIKRAQVSEYDSIADFIYRKMTIGGIVDKNMSLSTTDLKILKRLVNDELQIRKSKKVR